MGPEKRLEQVLSYYTVGPIVANPFTFLPLGVYINASLTTFSQFCVNISDPKDLATISLMHMYFSVIIMCSPRGMGHA